MFANNRKISHQKLNTVRSCFGERWCEQMSISIRREWSKSLLDIYAFIDATLQGIKPNKLVQVNTRLPLIDKATYVEEYEKQNQYLIECARRLHRAICFEIAEFLGTDTAGFVFLKLFKTALFVQLMLACSPHQIKQESLQTHIMTISGLIVGTHWIEQVQLLNSF